MATTTTYCTSLRVLVEGSIYHSLYSIPDSSSHKLF